MAKKQIKKNNVNYSDWSSMGNLIFFNKLEPQYFYFDLLLQEYSERSKEYNDKAKKIGESAKSKYERVISSLTSNVPEEGEELGKIDKIIEYLKKAIETETSNEIAFFKEKYQWFKSNFSEEEINALPELQYLFNFFKDASSKQDITQIDYDNFLIAINIIMQGYDNTKEIFKYEKNRLVDLGNRLEQATQASGNRSAGLAKAKRLSEAEQTEWRAKAEQKHRERVRVHYLQHKNFNSSKGLGLQKRLDKLATTVDVKVADWITNTIQKSLDNPQIRQNIIELIQQNQPQLFSAPEELGRRIKAILIQNITNFGIKNIGKIISEQISDSDIDAIIKESEQNFNYSFEIEGLYDTTFTHGILLDYYRQSNQLNKDGTKSAKKLYEALKRLKRLSNLANRKGSRIKLTPEQKFAIAVFNKKDANGESIFTFLSDIETLDSQINKVEQAMNEHKNAEINLTKRKKNVSKKLTGKEGKTTFTLEIKEGKIKRSSLLELNRKWAQYAHEKGLGSDRIRAQSLEGIVEGLRTRLSEKVRDQLDAISAGDISGLPRVRGMSSQAQINKALQDGLEGITVFVGAPDLSELTEGLQLIGDKNNIKLIWTGKDKTKNDFVTITVDTPTAEITTQLSNILNTSFDSIGKNIEDLFRESQREVAEKLGGELTKFSSDLSKNKQYNKQTEIAEEYQKNEEEYYKLLEENSKLLEEMPHLAKLLKKVEEQNKGQSESQIIEKKKKLLQLLTNFFYQSSTMKTFNHYVNDVGFVGGSLGPNVLSQLEKIISNFEAAGINLGVDKEWLAGAIINCSSKSVLGTRNREKIEYYLGTMAVFAMFDEGELEETMIKNIDVSKMSSPKILHLYRLNGIYYCGSYVLKQILVDFQNYINQISIAKGSVAHKGVAILSGGISFGDLPNKGLEIPEDTDPWGTVSNKAQQRATISVVFLAGILQTLNRLESQINNIELPK